MSLVSYEVADAVTILTMNRPAALNALNGEMIAALEGTTARAAAGPDQGTTQQIVFKFAGRPAGGRAGGICALRRRAGFRRGLACLCRKAQATFRVSL